MPIDPSKLADRIEHKAAKREEDNLDTVADASAQMYVLLEMNANDARVLTCLMILGLKPTDKDIVTTVVGGLGISVDGATEPEGPRAIGAAAKGYLPAYKEDGVTPDGVYFGSTPEEMLRAHNAGYMERTGPAGEILDWVKVSTTPAPPAPAAPATATTYKVFNAKGVQTDQTVTLAAGNADNTLEAIIDGTGAVTHFKRKSKVLRRS